MLIGYAAKNLGLCDELTRLAVLPNHSDYGLRGCRSLLRDVCLNHLSHLPNYLTCFLLSTLSFVHQP
jgi:hypothetical protein